MKSSLSRAFVGVGSNISPRQNIPAGLELLQLHVLLSRTSTFYVTKPLGHEGQNDYLNGVWEIYTDRTPEELKTEILRNIEDLLGRVRNKDKFCSRTIDLDLLLFDDLIIHKPGLHIPDPAIYERPFIAFPLHELESELVLPDTGARLNDLIPSMSKEGLRPDSELTEILRTWISDRRSKDLWENEYARLQGICLDAREDAPACVGLFLDLLKSRNVKKSSFHVLDAGCGKGRVGLHLAKQDFRVTGMDFSLTALRDFCKAAREWNLDRFITLIEQDLSQPWLVLDSLFDAVFAITVIDNFPHQDQREQFVREARRVLKPRGLLVIQYYTEVDGYYGSLLQQSPRKQEGLVSDPFNSMTFRIYSDQEIRSLLQSGFSLIKTHTLNSSSIKYGKAYSRTSRIVIFEKKP
ncbi:MAG: 2-amino-4-hydroxy-6-hydroxymethyldihydropteridine diphosphokinase [Candidatus Aureabacteria bacterium]|nr:2-amino-4-hydroxy-6-hydroxymethyldihydropteridine diphosphokinase [Candidatus Auribacterota bacterium]